MSRSINIFFKMSRLRTIWIEKSDSQNIRFKMNRSWTILSSMVESFRKCYISSKSFLNNCNWMNYLQNIWLEMSRFWTIQLEISDLRTISFEMSDQWPLLNDSLNESHSRTIESSGLLTNDSIPNESFANNNVK